jgi:hypothetical protein
MADGPLFAVGSAAECAEPIAEAPEAWNRGPIVSGAADAWRRQRPGGTTSGIASRRFRR